MMSLRIRSGGAGDATNSMRFLLLVLALALAVAFGVTQLSAQSTTTGSVVGVVTDPSGAVVPDAAVTLKSNTQGTVNTTKTNSSGTFQFQLLAPGSFTLTVEASGFQKNERTIEVAVANVTSANVQISVASAGTTITVTEAAPLLQTDNGDATTTLSQQQVSQVPNPGNDLSYVAQLAPGSVMNTQGGFGNFSSYGLPATSNLFTLNGMDDNDPFLNLNNSGATNLLLGQNEISEATVVQNGYSGQFGGLAGANVNYITKAGGNQFHGNAIYYWNGKALNATPFLTNAEGGSKPFDNVNQWAGSIGGPIKKDKMFFFFNTEGLRVFLPTGPFLVDTPSAAFQADAIANLNASGLSASVPFYNQMFNIFNTAPGVANATTGQAPGQSIAQSCTSAITGLQLSYAGDPALGVTQPCVNNYFSSPSTLTHEWQAAGRFDWNIGPSDQLYFRMQYDHGLQSSYTDALNPIFNAVSDQPEYQGQISETHSFGPTATNQLLIAGQWYSAIFQPANLNASLAAFPTTLLLGDGSLGGFDPQIGGQVIGGSDVIWPQGRNVSQGQIQDDFSKSIGAHTIKFGGKWRRNWISDHDFGFFNSGLEIPITLQDFFAGGVDPVNGIGSELTQAFPASLNQPITEYSLQLYVQDEWRLKPNFTLSVALRGEHFSNPVCQHLCFATTPQAFDQIAHDPSIPYNQSIQTTRRQAALDLQAIMWEPRVSFAWQPFSGSSSFWKSNFVVRGGIGMYADQFPGTVADNASQNPPYYNTFAPGLSTGTIGNWLSPGETNATFTPNGNLFGDAATDNAGFLTGFASGQNLAQISALVPGFIPPGLATFDARNAYPQYEKWSLEVQKGFGVNTSLSVSYIGNHGYHELIQNNSINAFAPGGFGSLPTAPVDAAFSGVNWVTSGGVSNYNGLTTSFQHRFTKWTQGVFQFNYTWSHAFDEVSNGGFLPFGGNGINPQDPYNFRGNYGPADYDVRHYINANYVYELPVRKMFGGHGSKYLVDGWQVSGAVFYRTGLPYSVIDTSAASTLGISNYGGAVMPQFLGGALASCGVAAVVTSPTTPCVTGSQFTAPGAETGFPSGLRNLFYGPGYFNTDFTVVKNTRIPGWEAGKLGIGLQFFNLFNHPNFNNPDGDVSSPTFGQITSQPSSPTSILGSFLGGNASPRLVQMKVSLTF